MRIFTLFSACILSLYLLPQTLRAQGNDPVKWRPGTQDVLYVASTGGLKLRSAPDLNAPVLLSMPFGAELRRWEVDPTAYGYAYQPFMTADSHAVTFIPVEYAGQRGWCVQEYLNWEILEATVPWTFAGSSGAGQPYHLGPDYAGWVLRLDGGQLRWEKVRLTYYADEVNSFWEPSQGGRCALMCITSRPLKAGTVRGVHEELALSSCGESLGDPQLYTRKLLQPGWTAKLVDLRNAEKNTQEYFLLVDNGKGKRQVMGQSLSACMRIHLQADLDQDGIVDMVIDIADGDYATHWRVYLSSMATGNELLGYAGEYWGTSCC